MSINDKLLHTLILIGEETVEFSIVGSPKVCHFSGMTIWKLIISAQEMNLLKIHLDCKKNILYSILLDSVPEKVFIKNTHVFKTSHCVKCMFLNLEIPNLCDYELFDDLYKKYISKNKETSNHLDQCDLYKEESEKHAQQ